MPDNSSGWDRFWGGVGDFFGDLLGFDEGRFSLGNVGLNTQRSAAISEDFEEIVVTAQRTGRDFGDGWNNFWDGYFHPNVDYEAFDREHTGYVDAMGTYYPGTGSMPGNDYNPLEHPRLTAGLMVGTLAAPYALIWGGTAATTSGGAMILGGGIGGGVQTLDEGLHGRLDTPEAWGRISIATGGGAISGGSGGVIANQVGGRTVMAIGTRALANTGVGAATGLGQAELNARISSGWEYGASADQLRDGALYGGVFSGLGSAGGDVISGLAYSRFGGDLGESAAQRYEVLRWYGLDTPERLALEGVSRYASGPYIFRQAPSVYGVYGGGIAESAVDLAQPPIQPWERRD